jgi:tagatose-6-phosphate ketose/aldose isomerase
MKVNLLLRLLANASDFIYSAGLPQITIKTPMDHTAQGKSLDALAATLALAEEEKKRRGLVYTPREIAQQPETWGTTCMICLDRSADISRFLESSGIGDGSGLPAKVILVGAGTSDYVGESVQSLLAKEWGCEAAAIPSTDLLTNAEDVIRPDRRYLWISFSRSGDSPEAVAVLGAAVARFPLVRHIVVTCNEHARLVREFGERPNVLSIVLSDRVNDRSLAMTSSFSNMVVAGQCLAHIRSPRAYGDILHRITVAAEQFISPCADLAARLARQSFSKVCFLGTGPLKAVARESALKVLELTAGRVYTFYDSYLGLRHGPLSAVDGSTLVVAYISGDERRRSYELDLLEELKEKRLPGRTAAVCPFPTNRIHAVSDDTISLDVGDVPDDYRPIIDVIFAQLLGLFASVHLGMRPDTPSPNGAISRVVRPIKIYEEPAPRA